MRYSGVLFDLFGTLVPPFRMREHDAVLRKCAGYLEISFDECYRLFGDTVPRRMRGEFDSIAANFDWVARHLGKRPHEAALNSVTVAYERFTVESLTPVSGALEALAWLKSHGVRVALVTNCGPGVPNIWHRSPLAGYFDACAFSCEVGTLKPDPGIYQAALDTLGLHPGEALYVGDGSDEELSGAERCGLRPVLVSVDLSNTYDAQRSELQTWRGPRISDLSELKVFVEGADEAEHSTPSDDRHDVRRRY